MSTKPESTVSGCFLAEFEKAHGYPFDDEAALWRIPSGEMRDAILWEYGRETGLISRHIPDGWSKHHPRLAASWPWLALSAHDKQAARSGIMPFLAERWRFWIPSPLAIYSTTAGRNLTRADLGRMAPDLLSERPDTLHPTIPVLMQLDITATRSDLMQAFGQWLDSIPQGARQRQAKASVSRWLKTNLEAGFSNVREALRIELGAFLPEVPETDELRAYTFALIETASLEHLASALETAVHAVIDSTPEASFERARKPTKKGECIEQGILLNLGCMRLMHHLNWQSEKRGEVSEFDAVANRYRDGIPASHFDGFGSTFRDQFRDRRESARRYAENSLKETALMKSWSLR